MSNVVKLYPKDAAKNPDNVLEQAVGTYDEVFVIGYDKDGRLDVRASTNFKSTDIVFALETFKSKLFNGDYNAPAGEEDQ